jgi:hypothetical protein
MNRKESLDELNFSVSRKILELHPLLHLVHHVQEFPVALEVDELAGEELHGFHHAKSKT